MLRLIELSDPVVMNLINRLCEQEVPMRTALILHSLRDRVVAGIDRYEDIRVSLLNKYGKKNEDGSLYIVADSIQFINDSSKIQFVAELEEAANIRFEREVVSKEDLSELRITADNISILKSLIDIV